MAIVGVVGIYFIFLIDDIKGQFDQVYYYKAFFCLLMFQCVFVFSGAWCCWDL
jgi:hypothetical protein